MENKNAWESAAVIRSYADCADLHKPEEAIRFMLGEHLKDMRMLDIGVGGGRTTEYFAPLVKEYIGIDYSQGMIDVAKARFLGRLENVSFELCDARSMAMFPDGYFDFVLFSYNGIDYVTLPDRIRILREVSRVTRHGGYFLFSTHNLDCEIERDFSVHLSRNLKRFTVQMLRYLIFRILNRNLDRRRRDANHLIINDGAHWFRLKTFYIRPAEQINQLKTLGFDDVNILTLDGRQQEVDCVCDVLEDSWLYYFCRIKKH